jgi:hypothetical protein
MQKSDLLLRTKIHLPPCAGYLTHPSVLWNFKHEFRQSTPIFPSTKMSLKDHFQENTPFTNRQIQLDLISRSSIDTIHPRSSGSDAERSVSIQISRTGIAVM